MVFKKIIWFDTSAYQIWSYFIEMRTWTLSNALWTRVIHWANLLLFIGSFLLLAHYIVSREWGMTLLNVFCAMLCTSQELVRSYAFGRQASSCLAVMGRGVHVLVGINSRSDNSCWVRWTKFSSWFRNV